MPKVSHSYSGPLVVAGVTIAPGSEAEVSEAALEAWAKNAAAAKWLETGLVSVAKPRRGRKPKADKIADDETQSEG